MQCECEHSSHFDDVTAHPYGSSARDVDETRTVCGEFKLCRSCRTAGHMLPRTCNACGIAETDATADRQERCCECGARGTVSAEGTLWRSSNDRGYVYCKDASACIDRQEQQRQRR